MKKLLAVLLAAAMLFAFAACGGDKSEAPDDLSQSLNQSIDSGKAEAEEPEETEGTEEIEETEETEVEKAKLSRGSITGDVYANEYLDLTFTKPADWKYLSDKEISETINAGQDSLDFSDMEKLLVEQASVYDIAARDDLYGNSVMICYENTEITAGRKVTVKEYADTLKKGLEAQTALTYTFEEESEATLGGRTYKKLVFSAITNGVEIVQVYYVDVIDIYAVGIIATLVNTEIAEVEAMFS